MSSTSVKLLAILKDNYMKTCVTVQLSLSDINVRSTSRLIRRKTDEQARCKKHSHREKVASL